MACDNFFGAAGWHCSTINVQGKSALYISTPIVLTQGKPLDFYLIERGDEFQITDDGTAINEFRLCGISLDRKNNWRGLANLATAKGFRLDDTGQFAVTFPKQLLPVWSGKLLELYGAIASWEKEKLSEQDPDFVLAEEIELILRSKAPTWKLERNAEVTAGKIKMAFDFLWGDYLVDAVRPLAQSVNSKLRKAIIISRHDVAGKKPLFIIDDRTDAIRAEEELAVLGEVAKAAKLSNFQTYFNA